MLNPVHPDYLSKIKRAFKKGFKAAKEKYGFTEGNVKQAFREGVLLPSSKLYLLDEIIDEFIQSLKQPLPEFVEVEYIKEYDSLGIPNGQNGKPKLNSQDYIEIHIQN